MADVVGGSVIWNLNVDDSKYSAGLQSAQQKMASVDKTIEEGANQLALAFEIGMVGVVASIGEAVKSAADFQSAMELIQTQAGASTQEVQTMSKAILDMAANVGTTPEELATGLYHIESAGFRGAQALNMLQAAAEGAKTGNANLEDVTQAMISLTASHIKGIQDETQAMGVLNAIVGSGDMKMQGLAQAMSTGIMPAAATFGLSVQDVGAALATLTDNAVPPIDAATRLRMTISLLGAPSQQAKKDLESIGIGATQLATDMRTKGLFDALEDLQTHLKDSGKSATESAALLSNMFGGGRSSSAILTLLDQMDRFKSKYADITEGTNKFGSAWAETQQTVNFQISKLQATLSTIGIQLGTDLLPALNNVATFLSGTFIPAIEKTVKFFKDNPAAVAALAVVLTTLLLPALFAIGMQMGFLTFEAGTGFALATPAIFTFIGAVYSLAAQFIVTAAQAVVSAATTVGAWVSAGVKTAAEWVTAGAKMIAQFVASSASAVKEAAIASASWVASAAQSAAGWVVNVAKMVAQFIVASAAAVAQAAKSALAWVVAAHNSEAGFVGSLIIIVAKFVWTATEAGINAAVTSYQWVLSSTVSLAAWVANAAKTVAQFVIMSAGATAQALVTSAKWTLAATVTLAEWVKAAPKVVAEMAVMSAGATKNALISSAAWIKSAVVTLAQWTITSAETIVQYSLMGVAAVSESAVAVAAFLAQIAQLIVMNTWIEIVKTATVVWTGIQWLLNAALDANPIAIVILAIAGLVAAIVVAYNNSKTFRDMVNGLWNDFKAFIDWIYKEAIAGLSALGKAWAAITAPPKVSVGHNASGTNNWGGGLTWVGENGPELLNLPAGSAIYSNSQSQSMLGQFAKAPAIAPAYASNVQATPANGPTINLGTFIGTQSQLRQFSKIINDAYQQYLKGRGQSQ